MSDALTVSTCNRTARKTHICVECRGQIEKGEVYEFISGIWDDGPASFKTCPTCADLRAKVFEEYRNQWWDNEEVLCFGQLREVLSEINCENAEQWKSEYLTNRNARILKRKKSAP